MRESSRAEALRRRQQALLRQAKPSKWRNVKTQKFGHTFDSKREADRYGDLLLLVAAKQISVPELQVSYRLEVNGVLIATYRADFRYVDYTTKRLVVEDAKGVRTREFIMKAKLMKALHRIDVLET